MQIGAVFPQNELAGDADAVATFVAAVEELGYHHLLAYDHVLGAQHADREPPLVGPYDETHGFHDPFVLFGYVAGRTQRLGLVTGVLVLPQRQTALVARQAADLALLSGGRLRLGVGVGWNHVEYGALGQPFSARGARLDEQVEVLRRLWSEPVVSVTGRFDAMERVALVPRPAGTIPIWFGGWSDVALRRAARIGDGFIFNGNPARVASQWHDVRSLVDAGGRSVDEFGGEYVAGSPTASVDDIAGAVEQWRQAGGSHATVITTARGLRHVDEHLELLAAVADRLGVG